MRRSIGFFSVMAALNMFVLGTGCSSGVTGPPEPPEPSSPLFAVWLADAWEITDLSGPDRNASSWSYRCASFFNGVDDLFAPLRCSVFWLSAVQDSFEIGTTIPAHTGLFGSSGPTHRSLNRGSLALLGIRATLTGAGPSHFDDRLPIVWEAMLEGNVLRIEGTGTWNFSEESQPVPARWVVRLRRCPAEWLHGPHGARGSWCNPFKGP